LTHPLRITDKLLFANEELNAKNVLAATLGYPNRNPSLTQLAHATGLSRHTVQEVQKNLDKWTVRIVEEHADGSATAAFRVPRARYDRPDQWYDREKNSPRFNRSNRLATAYLAYDPDHEDYASLPAAIVDRLPRKSKSASLLRMVALVYAREQLIRGAIQIEDEVIARRLDLWELRNGFMEGPGTSQVKTARHALIEAHILVVYDTDAHPFPIYVMPGATPQRPENPAEFQPEWTKRFQRAEWIDTFASDSQFDTILSLARILGEDDASEAMEAAGLDPWGDEEGEDVIESLRAALPEDEQAPIENTPPEERTDTYLGTNRHLPRNEQTPTSARTDTGQVPLPRTSTPSSAEGAKTDHTGEDGDGFSGEEEAVTSRPRFPRHELGADFFNIFCFADDQTFQIIEAWKDHFIRKYGQGDAAELLRAVFLEHGPLGRQIVTGLHVRFPDVQIGADEPEVNLDDLIGGFQNVAE